MSVHVIVATDGSQTSLAAARALMSFADPAAVTAVTVVAVISPLATVPFVDELSVHPAVDPAALSFREEAEAATRVVLAEFQGWGAVLERQVRSGSPAAEIVRAAGELDADLVVVASGSKGLSETILLGSTAQRVQHSAPCPVLVFRPKHR